MANLKPAAIRKAQILRIPDQATVRHFHLQLQPQGKRVVRFAIPPLNQEHAGSPQLTWTNGGLSFSAHHYLSEWSYPHEIPRRSQAERPPPSHGNRYATSLQPLQSLSHKFNDPCSFIALPGYPSLVLENGNVLPKILLQKGGTRGKTCRISSD